MKKLGWVLVICCTFSVAKATADDIDIYLGGTSSAGAPYVHLMMDYGPILYTPLCSYGRSCSVVAADGSCPLGEVCFSQDAYDRLLEPNIPALGAVVTRFDALLAVMSSIITNPLFSEIYMALPVSNWGDGGTLLEGYKLLGGDYLIGDVNDQLLDPDDGLIIPGDPFYETGAEKIIAALRAIPRISNIASTHKLQPKETYFEWYRYLNGGAIINGKSTGGNFGSSILDDPTPDYDRSIMNSGNYISPFTDPAACSKMYSILVAMSNAEDDDDLDLDGAIADPQFSGLDIDTSVPFHFADFLREIQSSSMDLVDDTLLAGINPLEKTWVITTGNPGSTTEWATAGGSDSPLNIDNPVALEESLYDSFTEISSVSSTFVAASVPANVFNRAESLDNLFVALFEARANQNWPGNIKKLKLRDIDGDGAFDDIIDASTPIPKPGFVSSGADRGRITFDALTYWTDVLNLPPVAASLAPPGADGRMVARGGAGQKITGFLADAGHIIGDTNAVGAGVSSRQVYVEPASFTNGTATAFDDFDADNETLALTGIKADLGDPAMTDAEALDLIRWGRGQDPSTGLSRSWILAEAIHSRPLAVNYGTAGGYSTANPNIRLFYGTGDGLFHVVENTTTAGVESGSEVFAFYPREFLGNIEIRKTGSESSQKMRYGPDGPAVALVVDNNNDGNIVPTGSSPVGGDEVLVYFGGRRGGNSYYALNVSNPSVAPKIQWKISQTISGDFDELGLTFSKPIVGKVKYGASAVDVLIFGGGYNGGWDAGYTSRVGKDLNSNPDTVGNAIYIVNARTGALIWKATQGGSGTGSGTATEYLHPDLEDSIPSDITPMKNANGVIHRLYVGDTGGAVWRVDLPALASDDRANQWFISKLAELGNDGINASTDRRFFHAPDLIESRDDIGDFDGLIISSGDRAHPNETAVTNYHFYIKDRLIASGAVAAKARTPLTAEDPVAPVVADLPDQALCFLGTETDCAAQLLNGWKIEMVQPGEKGLSTALVDGGRVFLSTFVPAPAGATCAPTEGEGFVYVVNLADATSTYNNRYYAVGSGIPSGAVTLGDSILVPGGGIDPVNPLDPNEELCVGKLCGSLTERLYQIYWREPGIDDL